MNAMKFEIGDAIDAALCKTLAHEMLLCNESFQRFNFLASMNILGSRTKIVKINTHDAYASFLLHLYEFYQGCFQRDRRTTQVNNTDKLFDAEVEKLLQNRRDAITKGYAPDGENPISYYQVDVPKNFGEMFRKIRNRTAHSLVKRSTPGGDITLLNFYQNYHKFIYLLYVSGKSHWTAKNIELTDWGAIEDFDLFVSRPSN